MNTVLPYIIAVIEGGVYLILVFTVFGPDLSDAIVIGIVIGLSLKMVANVLAVTGSCNEKRTQLSVSFISTYPAGLIVYLSIAFGGYFFVLIPLIHYVYNIVLLRSIYYMMDELDRRQTSGVQSSSYELVSLPQPPEKQDPGAEEISAV